MAKRKFSNLLAVRVQPWQLFRFKKMVEFTKRRPSDLMQDALQIYFSHFPVPKKTMDAWIDEYHAKTGNAE